ncbi:MAG TPA: recombinase family protein [Fimbriiglobus sp.]|nr:recombinase family protein [Fimbriiglobus sp.]
MSRKNRPAPTAYSYIRFSSPNQADGDSVRRQTAKRDAWLERNGVRLKSSLTLRDEGVSGFHGLHRHKGNSDRYGLACFLALVEAGKIARGSYLIVENLDRLSREHIQPALMLFLGLLQAGVRIVQLSPAEQVFDDKSDSMALMMAIMELSRGNSESRMKSERVGQAWAAKKRRAGSEILTPTVPSWCRVEGKRIVLDRAKAAVVRRIYQMAIDGFGISTIVKRLNAEGVSSLANRRRKSGASTWSISTVYHLLKTRTVLGEYQPYTQHGVKPVSRVQGGPPPKRTRVPDGPPLPGYYPAVVTESVWFAAQAALTRRFVPRARGRTGAVVNVFAGLLTDARDGGPLHVQYNSNGRYVVPDSAKKGLLSWASFPAEPFETAILSRLKEIDPAEVLPFRDGGGSVVVLTDKLTTIVGRIARIQAALGDDEVEAAVRKLRELEAEKKTVTEELAVVQAEVAAPPAGAWGECRSLVDALATATDVVDTRTRLRSALRRTVEGIWCLFMRRGRDRVAAVQVRFVGGHHRDYLIFFSPAWASGSLSRPATCRVSSAAIPALAGQLYFDLRNLRHVGIMTAVLAKTPLEVLLPGFGSEGEDADTP